MWRRTSGRCLDRSRVDVELVTSGQHIEASALRHVVPLLGGTGLDGELGHFGGTLMVQEHLWTAVLGVRVHQIIRVPPHPRATVLRLPELLRRFHDVHILEN